MVSRNTDRAGRAREAGFTLIELMIVMAIIGVLAAIAIPSYVNTVRRAKESALREDLHTMRDAISSYTVDKEKSPNGLDDLVQAGYLKTVPKDPITDRNDTWIADQGSDYSSIEEIQSGGVTDVHSGSQAISSEGTTYNTW